MTTQHVDYPDQQLTLAARHAIMNPGHSVTTITDRRTEEGTSREVRVLVVGCNGTPETFMQLGTDRDCDYHVEIELTPDLVRMAG